MYFDANFEKLLLNKYSRSHSNFCRLLFIETRTITGKKIGKKIRGNWSRSRSKYLKFVFKLVIVAE
jgi:hypothetical protein